MPRNPENKYFPGKWLFYCDVCNRKMLSSDAYKRWDGLYVCKNDWEPRHPSDFIRARKETSNQLPWSRPPVGEIDVSPTYSDEYIRITDGLTREAAPFYGQYVYDPSGPGSTLDTSLYPFDQYMLDNYVQTSVMTVDTAYAGTGVFYWYDTTQPYSPPEAYVTGDYL